MPGCSTSPRPALRDRQPRFQPALVQCLQHALNDRQVVAVGGPSCSSTMAPVADPAAGGRAPLRRATDAVEAARAPADPTRPSRCSTGATNGLVMPTTERYQRTGRPLTACSACWQPSISARIAAGPSRQKRACGWLWLWLPRSWPRRRISCTSSGCASARSPTRKRWHGPGGGPAGRARHGFPGQDRHQWSTRRCCRHPATGSAPAHRSDCWAGTPAPKSAWLATISGPQCQPARPRPGSPAAATPPARAASARAGSECDAMFLRCSSP